MTNVFCIVCIAKERKVLELDVKKGVTELTAQKKVLEDKELALAPIDLSFDRVKFGCYHAQFLEKLFKKPIGKLKMNKNELFDETDVFRKGYSASFFASIQFSEINASSSSSDLDEFNPFTVSNSHDQVSSIGTEISRILVTCLGCCNFSLIERKIGYDHWLIKPLDLD